MSDIKKDLPRRIRLMVSDVDGTLVNREKQVAPATVEAVARLRAAGVAFAAVSARPPRGMKILVEALGLDIFGGFNGGSILSGGFDVLEQHFVAEDAARRCIEIMAPRGASIWVFADNEWYLTDPDNTYVAGEIRTVAFQPTLVSDFGDHLARAGKIVFSSTDFDMLAKSEPELQALVGDGATARRSQNKYLDLTPPGTDKGHAVRAFARHYGVALDEVAVIGDMANDLPMFEVGGLSIAMGNASDAIKQQADLVTLSNAEDGVAHAIEQFVLPRA
ncbi:HAD family hydrolase [Ancylobacter amanitiformis]|uniref:Cof subfamily protein (Haloacid dehalogenase superfamily) n=1 Tax=Ancylobacter amanitiformis TaxID=217069 RepID=A0ABU0LQZ4_9HYPH|nr:HAD family hydrolase [Ancylobacter amanitiformis]MDQ0511127.1 Cof subfamily protein (haloacid dehalogenase superfamily) [Ancylobacter amanitiformis]